MHLRAEVDGTVLGYMSDLVERELPPSSKGRRPSLARLEEEGDPQDVLRRTPVVAFPFKPSDPLTKRFDTWRRRKRQS
ncbi:MAG: hypothetical protein Q8P35_03230 [Candidatus Yanofskybacteria bacterium]|nr:hypothetical protein [Candidatus Yanofskybacteria bacterium]